MMIRKKITQKIAAKPTEAYGLLKTSLKYQTKEFFYSSTLHGVRYISEKGRPFSEKFMWFCLVSIGAVAAFVIIGSLWEKFQTNPTITGLDTDFHNQQVFFPTVTICPVNAFSPSIFNETSTSSSEGTLSGTRNESESGGGDYNEENSDGVVGDGEEGKSNSEDYYQKFLKALPALSYDTFGLIHETLQNISQKENVREENLRQLAFKVGIKCDELLEICKYKDEEITCCEYFMPLYSEHGLCYSFNSRYYSTPDNEIKNDKINDLFETDKKWSLTFVPTVSSRVYVHSIDEISGYDFRKIFVHDIGFAITLLISMKQTYTTDDARQLTVAQRKCIFPDEKRLKYHKDDVYSFSHCMKQCRMERAQFFCSCVPIFYLPSTESAEGINPNYRHCGMDDFSCLLKFHDNITNIRMCKHCELSCLNTVYDIEKFSKVMVPESNKREDFHINIEFLTWPIIRYKREVLFGWVDLLVSFGGIAGLFLGFSLLSGVEIIYYFTMRAGCMMYKNREELYNIQREKEIRPKSQYDLSLKPKLKESERLKKSLSLPQIQTVRPVESSGSNKIVNITFESPKVPIKKKPYVNDYAISRFINGGVGSNKKRSFAFTPQPPPQPPLNKIIFRPVQLAPYASKIKPLDKKFRIRSHSEGPEEIIFDGYLA